MEWWEDGGQGQDSRLDFSLESEESIRRRAASGRRRRASSGLDYSKVRARAVGHGWTMMGPHAGRGRVWQW
jgi:hypothetical protein